MISPTPQRSLAALIVLVLSFICLVWPVILWGADTTSEAYDQNHHHIVVIRQATASVVGETDSIPICALLRDYPSATSPGYHLFLAVFDAIGLGDIIVLRLISSLFGLALVITVWRILCRRVDEWTAIGFAAPLICSPYFLSGSIWLTTDVAAVWFVMLALGSVLGSVLGSRSSLFPTPASRIRSGIFAALAVFVRQPTAWLIAPLFLSGLIAQRGSIQNHRSGWSRREWVCWICSIAFPLLVLGWLIVLWGGLMPPAYRSLHNAGANLATPAFALSLLALWGLPWTIASGAFGMTRIARCTVEMRWMGVGAILGILCAALPPTAFDQAAGRWGGPLWNIIAHAPVIANRSTLLLVLAPVGGVTIVMILRSAFRAGQAYGAAVLGVACAAMLGALTVNTQCWERYIDLPLLALLPVVIVLGMDRSDAVQQRRVRTACVLLTIVQFGLSLWMVYRPTFSN